MIRNEVFTPTQATLRNELIDAIERNDMVIYISKDISNEIFEEIKKNKNVSKSFRSFSWNAVVIGAFIIPGLGATIVGAVLAIICRVIGKEVNEFKSYRIGFDNYNDMKRLILVHKSFSFKHHDTSDDCIITNTKKCPKCNEKWNKNTFSCDACNLHIIFVK